MFDFSAGLFNKTFIDDDGIHFSKNEIVPFSNVIGMKFNILNTGSARITFALVGNEKKELYAQNKKVDLAKEAFQWLLEKTGLEDEETAFAFFQYEIDHPYRNEEILNKISNSDTDSDDKIARCPKCGSPSITVDRKRLSLGRAAVGGVLAGSIGAAVGAVTSKKNICICMKCGHKWKL